MDKPIKKIVIVGGGTSGWITAGVLAAEHLASEQTGVQVCLLESPNVNPIGVGEGTWPTMRGTLRKMGISETDFIRECDATFKQGAKFAKWVTGADDDAYYHPLVLPQGYQQVNLAPYWSDQYASIPFADAVSTQGQICEYGLAPKQHTTPEYAHVANYAYHLDAGKFTQFLQQHCTQKLGVKHILDDMIAVETHENGDIQGIRSKQNGVIEGDLFIDCTGFKSLLLGKQRKTLELKQYYQLHTNADYFLNNIDRIAEEDYIPTFEDYLRIRTRSTGFAMSRMMLNPDDLKIEHMTSDQNYKFKMDLHDFGGTRAERKKW